MLELLGTIFGGIFSGGATGLIGIVLQRVADYKNKQLDMQLENQRAANELAQRRADKEITQAEYEGKLRVATAEGAAASDIAESDAFGKSLLKEPERYSTASSLTPWQNWIMVLLDALRGAVRPLLTIYLCALTTVVWWQVKQKMEVEDLDAEAALAVWKMVVGQILYLTTTVVLWWFGTRNKSAQPAVKL